MLFTLSDDCSKTCRWQQPIALWRLAERRSRCFDPCVPCIKCDFAICSSKVSAPAQHRASQCYVTMRHSHKSCGGQRPQLRLTQRGVLTDLEPVSYAFGDSEVYRQKLCCKACNSCLDKAGLNMAEGLPTVPRELEGVPSDVLQVKQLPVNTRSSARSRSLEQSLLLTRLVCCVAASRERMCPLCTGTVAQ